MQQGSKMYCPHCQGFGSIVWYVTDGDRVPRILVLRLFMDFLIETRVLPIAERIYGTEGIQRRELTWVFLHVSNYQTRLSRAKNYAIYKSEVLVFIIMVTI